MLWDPHLPAPKWQAICKSCAWGALQLKQEVGVGVGESSVPCWNDLETESYGTEFCQVPEAQCRLPGML